MTTVRAAALVARWRIRHRWPGLLALGLLAGVVGGLATAAVAGERRTTSAAQRLVETTRAPEAFVFVPGADPAAVGARLRRLPDTAAIWPLSQSIGRATDTRDWYYPFSGERQRHPDLYRPLVDRGRLPAPDSLDEVAMSAATARSTGLDVGDTISMDLYTQDQILRIRDETERPPGGAHLELRVVGVIRDATDVASTRSERFVLASPAFYEARQNGVDSQYRGFAVRTRHGDAGMVRITATLRREFGPGSVVVRDRASSLEQIRPANRVLSAAIWVLGAVVVVIGGFVVTQAVRRHLGADASQERSLRAVGFTRADGVATATLPGLLSAAVAAATSAGVAVALSPLFPLGRARLLEPAPGLRVDGVVLPAGALATLLLTAATFSAMAWLDLRPRRRSHRQASRSLSGVASLTRPPVLLGLHLAADPALERRGISARTAVAGAALGVAGLVAASTFAHSLDGLVRAPVRFGLDYDLALEVPEGAEVGRRMADLGRHPDVAAVAEEREARIVVAGEEVSGVALRSTTGSIQPVLVAGRLPAGPDEVLLGPTFLREHGLGIGDRVKLGRGARARRVDVVGAGLDTRVTGTELGRVALLHPDTLDEVAEGDPPYPLIVVRYRPGADPAAVTADLDRRWPYAVIDESLPAPPSPVQNLSDAATVPRLLVWFFAGLAVVSLTNGVVVTGRRSRHVLGVVRGLGFTSGQVRTTALTMGVTMAAVAVAAGIPLGLVLGSTTWSQVVQRVDLVPVVDWPVVVCLLAVPLVLAVAAVASAWPARLATAHRPAEILRTE